MRSDNKLRERLGESRYNSNGSKMTIIEYNSNKNITVMFESGEVYKSDYNNFKKGNIKSVYDRTVANIGYNGEGIYKPKIKNKITNQYQLWRNMIVRCYDENHHKKYPSYKNCTVAEGWHNFQNFAKWYDENYYEVDGEEIQLDKDILIKNNKIYSPKTCIFVTRKINNLFIKRKRNRGKYPIGVHYDKSSGKFKAQYNDINNNRRHLGLFNTPEEAFKVYKIFKEALIRDIADEYKDKIPNNLYNALISYKIEIDD